MYFDEQRIFPSGGRSNYRIPSIVISKDGTVHAFCNDRRDSVADEAKEVMLVYRRKKPGQPWEAERVLTGLPGWSCMIGSAVYDEETDTVFCSVNRNPSAQWEFAEFAEEEKRALAAECAAKAEAAGVCLGQALFCSTDGGDTWTETALKVEPSPLQHFEEPPVFFGVASCANCHGSAHGIQLKKGKYAGRLLCPSRYASKSYHSWDDLRKYNYNNTIFSDDHGRTWQAGGPVQVGTGEGTLIERGDGSILYNSRAYFQDQKRYLAVSTDGGESFADAGTDDFLLEEKSIGCNAAFLRTELSGGRAVTLFSNPRSDVREKMTVCVSFDDGKTWEHTRLIWEGGSAYSSLSYDEVSGHFFLLYEKGTSAANPYEFGIVAAEFDLEWILGA